MNIREGNYDLLGSKSNMRESNYDLSECLIHLPDLLFLNTWFVLY